MDFGYALNALQEGCKVQRSGWQNKKYIYLQPVMPHIIFSETFTDQAGAVLGTYEPSQQDILADDWSIKE